VFDVAEDFGGQFGAKVQVGEATAQFGRGGVRMPETQPSHAEFAGAGAHAVGQLQATPRWSLPDEGNEHPLGFRTRIRGLGAHGGNLTGALIFHKRAVLSALTREHFEPPLENAFRFSCSHEPLERLALLKKNQEPSMQS
jgi:hypothetical protein